MVKKLTKKIKKLKLFQAKMTTLFFGFIGIFTLSFIGYFLYFQISEAKDVDDILPAENLIAFTEFSKSDLAQFIQDNEDFKALLLDPLLLQYLNQDLTEFTNQAKLWLGNKIAFAAYASANSDSHDSYFLFLENNSQRKALEFLRSLGVQGEELKVEEYQNFDILTFSQSLNLNCTFLYGYLICSNENAPLKNLIDINQSEFGFLSSLENYIKVKDNLPKMAGGKLFYNLQKINFTDYELYLGPLKKYLKEGGLTFTQINQGVRLNSYMSFEKGLVATGGVVTKNDLDKYVHAENLGVFLGGTNLTESFQQILKVWDEISPYFAIIVEGMLRARIVDYFGPEVSLEEDIYQLLKNDYALEIQLLPIPQLKLVLNIEETEKVETILAKMLEGFYLKSEKFKNIKKETQIQDGPFVKELLIDEEKVQVVETDFFETTIHSVEIENVPLTFAYAVQDDIAIIGTSRFAVQENLSLLEDSEKSLVKNPAYINAKSNMYLSGEETTFIDLKKVSQFMMLFGIDTSKNPFLSAFDFLSLSTKWFDDGMSSEAILLK